MKMNKKQVRYYEAGIKDANEAKRIVFAYESKRYESLSCEYGIGIGKESIACMDAYNKGVAYEINRQARLEA